MYAHTYVHSYIHMHIYMGACVRVDLANGSFGSGSDRVKSVRFMFGLANVGFGSGAVQVKFDSG